MRSLSDRSARHNCWAFRVGAVERCTDDGEPSGTAGRPLLAALGAADGALILVVRHFGGVLLGTGGLSRAYGAAASAAVADAGLSWEPHRVGASLACTFADRAAVEAALGACGAQREGEAPEGDGGERLLLRVSVPAAGAAGLAQALRNATAGRVQLDITQP